MYNIIRYKGQHPQGEIHAVREEIRGLPLGENISGVIMETVLKHKTSWEPVACCVGKCTGREKQDRVGTQYRYSTFRLLYEYEIYSRMSHWSYCCTYENKYGRCRAARSLPTRLKNTKPSDSAACVYSWPLASIVSRAPSKRKAGVDAHSTTLRATAVVAVDLTFPQAAEVHGATTTWRPRRSFSACVFLYGGAGIARCAIDVLEQLQQTGRL